MIPIEPFVAALARREVDFFTGVPCSYLKSFVSYAASGHIRYLAAASEGEAVGIAAGAYLGGGPGLVLIQNSGLGNCVNPLTSLIHTFEIPMLLLVSHRGEGGVDAPQHLQMGQIMLDLLRVMGIPAYTLGPDLAQGEALVDRACDEALSKSCAVALVAPKGSFEPYQYAAPLEAKRARSAAPAQAAAAPRELAPRVEVLRALCGALDPRDLVVATTGMTSRELFAVEDREANFYMMGSMGCAPGIGLGLATRQPGRKVIVLDGDGALLMKLGAAATIGHYAPEGLLHLVLDNGTYETTGGQPTVSPSVSFEQIAHAVGYRAVVSASSPEALCEVVRSFRVGDGPVFAVLRIADGHMPDVPRVGPTPQEIRDRFRACALS